MSQGLHLISSNIPGYGISEGRCLPCSGISGRAYVSSYSSHRNYKLFPQVKILLKNNLAYDSRRLPFACTASSSGHRRSPDFSRQSRQGHGFSRNKNRQNQEKANSSENIDETEFLSSKNGPLLSLSGSPKFQATATPGPREKEIVELFRKVQAQLRERAAIKEEKKIEASQGPREQGTVDSLLKLLRKHSSERGKKSSISSSEDFNLNPQERNGAFDDEPNPNFFDSDSIATEKVQEPRPASFIRPASNFQRKSPVPRIKYQSVVYSTDTADESINLIPSSKSQEKKRKSAIPPDSLDREPISLESQDEAFDDLSESSDPDEAYESVELSSNLSESSDPDEDYESVEPSSTEDTDLGSLKVSELRVLAKSRGVKGYSKLKKGELLELLSN